ncbi:MAG: hypothetical protein DWI23_00505 [Planctomycetota bacterium]|nr:MAG: hypothetical protein DWI23_00505 [Planctomycetota bacterium]
MEKAASMARGIANARSEILPRDWHGERGRTPQRLLRPAERMNQIKNPLELGRAPTGQNSMIFWQCCFTSRIAPASSQSLSAASFAQIPQPCFRRQNGSGTIVSTIF